MDKYLEIQGQVTSLGTAYLDFGCLRGQPRDDFVGETLIYALFPVVLITVVFVVAAVKNGGRSGGWKLTKATTSYLGVLVLFFMQPYLVKRFALVFSCVKLGSSSTDLYLSEDFAVQCWVSGRHWVYIVLLGLPLFLVYVLGVPLAVYLILSRPDSKLKIAQISDWLNSYLSPSSARPEGSSDTSVKFRDFQKNYGFLFVGYKPQYYYWEIVVMIRKACLSLLGVVFAFDIRAQVNLGILVLMVAAIAQAYLSPFDSKPMNVFESISLATSTLTFFFGVFTTDAGEAGTK